MTEPSQPQLDTASLLAAGVSPTRAGGRWPAPSPDQLAGAFPNLQILELIGAGGMGAVYLARQIHLDRLVAVKLLAPRHAADPGFDERFAREARALARLDHPSIVAVHDFGRVLDRSYLVMQHIDGSNLRQVIATGTLSGTEVLRLVRQICDALEHAHGAGVVHRDLKPENILIDGRGNAHIADFGLAKLNEGGHELTGTGEVLGTVHYMAPEQLAAAAAVDHRADLYALGVIIYEMLTGSLPLGRFAPPSSASSVAPGVDAVVLKSLEPDPGRRFGSASELRHALEGASAAPAPIAGAARAAGAPPSPTAPPPPRPAPQLTPPPQATPPSRAAGAGDASREERGAAIDAVVAQAMAHAQRGIDAAATRTAGIGGTIAQAMSQAGAAMAGSVPPAAGSAHRAPPGHPATAPGSGAQAAAATVADDAEVAARAKAAAAAPERTVDATVDPNQPKRTKVRMGLDGVHVDNGQEQVSVGWDGIFVKNDKEMVEIDSGGVRVRRGGTGGFPGQAAPASTADGARGSLFRVGMFAILLGSVVAISLGSEHVQDFYARPSAHFHANSQLDLAMFSSVVLVAGGIALLARCCLPVVILLGIAELLMVPWLWHDHVWLFWLYLIPCLWMTKEISNFRQVREHMGSLPWHDHLLRLIWAVPLIGLLLALPALPWIPGLRDLIGPDQRSLAAPASAPIGVPAQGP